MYSKAVCWRLYCGTCCLSYCAEHGAFCRIFLLRSSSTLSRLSLGTRTPGGDGGAGTGRARTRISAGTCLTAMRVHGMPPCRLSCPRLKTDLVASTAETPSECLSVALLFSLTQQHGEEGKTTFFCENTKKSHYLFHTHPRAVSNLLFLKQGGNPCMCH